MKERLSLRSYHQGRRKKMDDPWDDDEDEDELMVGIEL